MNFDEILSTASFLFDIPRNEILWGDKKRPTYRARYAVCWAARRETRASYPTIGRLTGGRDHTTIIHAIRQADKLRQSDPLYRAVLDVMSPDRIDAAP